MHVLVLVDASDGGPGFMKPGGQYALLRLGHGGQQTREPCSHRRALVNAEREQPQ